MYYYLIGGWVLYFVLHSVLATENAKRSVGFSSRTYRLLYSIFSMVALAGLMVLGGSISAQPFFNSVGIVRYLSLMMTTFGVMTIQVSFRQYRLKSFLGLSEEQEGMKIDGILQYIRHPIYAGIILVTIGFFLFIPNLPTLISCMSIFLYLPIGIYLEEKKLHLAFGDKYKLYRQQVPALIPRLPLLKKD